jgi:hypothetical protein
VLGLNVLAENGFAAPVAGPVDDVKPPLTLAVVPWVLGLNVLVENGFAAPVEGPVDEVKPVNGVEFFEGSVMDGSAALGENRLVEGGETLMTLANRFEVEVTGGSILGVAVDGCGVGVVGTSDGRARFDGDALRSSGLSSLTLRFVDKLDSLPVMPFMAARCFFKTSILFLSAELC